MAQKTIDFENDILRPIGSLKRGLADLDDNKITKFYTNNNGDTVLNDSDDGKIQDLVIYGKSEQAQYGGINLFNYKKETVTADGITFAYDEKNQTYKVNGTATERAVKFLLELTENIYVGKKIVGCPSGGSGSTYGIAISYFDGTGQWKVDYRDEGTGHIIQDYPKLYVYMFVQSGKTVNNLVFKPMIVEDTTKTYDDFEPYVGGKPSPSPEYPQEIKAVVNPVIKTHGKNLFNKKSPEKSGYIVAEDGTVKEHEGFNVYIYKYIDKPYTISYKKGNIFDTFRYGIESNGIITRKNASNSPFTVKLKEGERLYLSPHTDESIVYDIQIELGSTQTVYEPYHEQTATLPYELYAIPVSSGGNVTIDGQQYIADRVVEKNGVFGIERNIRKIHTNTKTMNNSEEFPGWNRVEGISDIIYYSEKSIAIRSNRDLTSMLNFSKATLYQNNVDTNNILFFYSSEIGYSQHELIKKAIDVDMYVRLQDVIFEPILVDIQAKLRTLVTNYPVTHISVNSEQLDGYTMFNYPVSMEKGWEYVKQQIGDTRKYVYDMETKTQDIDTQSAEAYVNSEYAVALTELEV